MTLSVAQERAVVLFKAHGVCFYVEDAKCKEIEEARLQKSEKSSYWHVSLPSISPAFSMQCSSRS